MASGYKVLFLAVIKYLLFTERPSLTSGPPPTTTTLTTTIKKTYGGDWVKGDMYGSRLNEINVIQSQKKTKEDAEYFYETTSSTYNGINKLVRPITNLEPDWNRVND